MSLWYMITKCLRGQYIRNLTISLQAQFGSLPVPVHRVIKLYPVTSRGGSDVTTPGTHLKVVTSLPVPVHRVIKLYPVTSRGGSDVTTPGTHLRDVTSATALTGKNYLYIYTHIYIYIYIYYILYTKVSSNFIVCDSALR